jgi:hypothetical protein
VDQFQFGILESSGDPVSLFGEAFAHGVRVGVEDVFACFGHLVEHCYGGGCDFDYSGGASAAPSHPRSKQPSTS